MKYLSIFASVLLATASAYGQSGESCRTASDPTLQKPELYAGYDCVNLLDGPARVHNFDDFADRERTGAGRLHGHSGAVE